MARWFVLAAVLCVAPAFADYSPPSIRMLVLGSDAIIEGTISNTSAGPDGKNFALKVRSVIAGPITTPELEVAKFNDWTCATRWAPYAAGQEVLLFLRKEKDGWRIQSAGGEGEMPIVDGRVITHYPELSLSQPVKHAVHGGTLYGREVPVADVLNAVRLARTCFTAKVSADGYRVEAVRASCAPETKAAAERAPLAAALFRSLAKN